MKKTNFFSRLKEERKLELIEPSKEMKESYLEKSESNLVSAKILLENNRLEEATSLAYFSMYHCLLALLFTIGIKSENHSASIILLSKIFGIDNSDISFAKKERIDKQYYVDFEVTEQDIRDLIGRTEDFNKKLLDFIAKVNNEKIKEFREIFKRL